VRAGIIALLVLSACGRSWVRVDHMVVQPGSTCHVLLELDDWQYPQDDRLSAQVTGIDELPIEVRRCLLAGVSLERTERPRLAELLAERLHELGWLDAKLEVPAEGPIALTLGARYDFGAVQPAAEDSRALAEAFSKELGDPSPYDWSRVVAAQ